MVSNAVVCSYWSEEYLIFAICYAKNGNFQINLEVRGGPGEFFHGQVIIKIGLNFYFLGVTKSPRPPQNLAVLSTVPPPKKKT